MIKLIDLPDLLIYLIPEGLLTSDDIEKLKIAPHPHYTRSDAIYDLAHLIERKGENGLVKFISALRKSTSAGNQPGHQELLQLLEDDLGASTDCANLMQEQTHAPPMFLPIHRRPSSEEVTSSFVEHKSLSSESSPSSSPVVPNRTTVNPAPPDSPLDSWKKDRPNSGSLNVSSPHPVADTHAHSQLTRRTISHKDPPSQERALKRQQNLKLVPNPNERDLLHELGCHLFNTREYHVLQRYDHNIRTLIRCLCALLLTYQFVILTIVTLCEESGCFAVFQESENICGGVLHCFLLILLRIGTRVITPLLFISQLDVLAAIPQIPKSCSNIHEAMQKILDMFSPRHRKRIEDRQSDPSAVINESGELIKRNIKSSWIIVLHSFFFTWLLYNLGAFNIAIDKVIKTGQGICNLNFLYMYTTIYLPLVSSPVSLYDLVALGECISILAILLMVGILKEFYLYENRIACTYALKRGNDDKKLYNMLRKRWRTLDRYCYTTPPILFLLAVLTLCSGKGFTPEPSQEIKIMDILNWCFLDSHTLCPDSSCHFPKS